MIIAVLDRLLYSTGFDKLGVFWRNVSRETFLFLYFFWNIIHKILFLKNK